MRVAGYAPSSLVDTATLVSGSSYDIVLDAIQPTGYALSDAWQVGDAAELTQYDAVTPTAVVATITAIDQLTQTVTATLSGAPPSGTLTLEYRPAEFVAAQQQKYAYIANDDAGGNIIEFATENVAARQFAS